MMPRSALSLVGLLLLVCSLNDVDADVSHRRTRGRVLARTERNLGIGYQGRTDYGSKVGSKSGSKSKGDAKKPTAKPTESSFAGRVPVIGEKTLKPTLDWFDNNNNNNDPSGIDGRIDEPTAGGNTQTVIGVNPDGTDTEGSDGSNNNENEGSDGSNGTDGSDNNSSSGNTSTEIDDSNTDNTDGKRPPADINDEGTDLSTGGDKDSDSGNVSGTDKDTDSGNDTNDESEGSSSNVVGDNSGSEGGPDSEGEESGEPAGKGEDNDDGKGAGKGDGKGKGEEDAGQDGTGNEGNGDENGTGSSGETSGTDGSNSSGNSDGNNDGSNNDDSSPKVDVSDPSTVEDWGPAPDGNESDASTAVFCPGVSADKEVLINWIYAVEFSPELTVEQKAQAVTIMELKLVSEVLECNDQVALPGKLRNRRLSEDGVAGLNYMPLDAKNDNVVCFYSDSDTNSTGGVCETYFGRMEMYLQADADDNIATTSMLYKIQAVFQRNDFPAVDGVVRVWYLDPDLNDADGIADGGEIIGDGGTPPGDNSYSTGTMIAFAALGVSVFIALVLGAFRMRRNEEDVITTFEHSTVAGESAFVLPNSYKLDDAKGMSSIPEDDSDADSRYNCSVIISDGGFTSDGDSRADDAAFSANFDNVLGDDNDDDDDMNNDMFFRNSTSREYSEHRKSNLVSGADVGLGVRHSTVDVHQCTSAHCTICNYKPKDVEFIHKSPTTPVVSEGNFFPEDENNVA